RALDGALNASPDSTSTYTLDTTPPGAPTITSAPPATSSSPTPSWSFTGDPGVGFECQLTRGSTTVSGAAPCTSPQSYDLSTEPDGTYTFSVRAIDAIGGASAPTTSDYVLDRAAPGVPAITSRPGALGQSLQPAWDFAGDSGSQLECRLARGSTVISDFATC